MGNSQVDLNGNMKPPKSRSSDTLRGASLRKTDKTTAAKEVNGSGLNGVSHAPCFIPSQPTGHHAANGDGNHSQQAGNTVVNGHHSLPNHHRFGSSPFSSGGYGFNPWNNQHLTGPLNGGPVGSRLPRPVDRLHVALGMFHEELESLIALVSAPHPPLDGAVTAWKEEALAELLLEIVPALGATSSRVVEAIRIGMMNNHGAVRIRGPHF